jgi:GNAT superfamily N-acetyltransferase
MSRETDELAGRITLREVQLPADEEFLRGLYATTRDDMAALPLDDAQKASLIEMQFAAQAEAYTSQHPDADHYIVQLDGQPVGRYFVDRQAGEILGVDLALLPEYRSLGIGSFIIRSEFALAAETNRAFTFEVLKSNERAFQLYLRLGCVVTGDTGTHYLIAWRPSDHQTGAVGRD